MTQNDVGSAPYYGGIAFGAGYLLTFFGVLVHFGEHLVELLQGNGITTVTGLIYMFVFLYIICGIWLGVSIIRSSRSTRDSGNTDLQQLSSPITAFSLMMLLLGIANLVHVRTGDLANLSYLLNPSIIFVVSPVLLLIGFKMYKERPTESRAMGAILVFVSTVLLYFFAYAALGSYNILASDFNFSLSSGPLFSEPNVERISLLFGAFCSLLYVVPAMQKGSRRLALNMILIIGAILFSIGLMIFNFPATTSAITEASASNQQVVSLWVIAFGNLTLGISGVVILVSALLAAVFVYRTRQQFQTPILPTTKPTSQTQTPATRCRQCGWNNPPGVKYCGKCGLPLTDEETKIYE
jgi:hypothetical protein